MESRANRMMLVAVISAAALGVRDGMRGRRRRDNDRGDDDHRGDDVDTR